jgi:hypothetical protein
MKRKIIIILLAATFLGQLTFAQTTEAEKNLRTASSDTINGWKKGGLVGLNLSQASFSNWAAGGQNSISINGVLNLFANYKTKSSSWDNMLDMGYGLMKQGTNSSAIKTDDRLEISSKYGQAASKYWYYAALLSFRTQMTPGYNYPDKSVKISDLLAPAYLLAALGMDYKPSDKFSAFLAPITLKTTFVNNTLLSDAGAFGVNPGKKVRSEFGGYARFVYKNAFFKDKSVTLLSKLDLFSNYFHNPQNIDVNWETILGFKVNKYISAMIAANLLYDDDITTKAYNNGETIVPAVGPRTQFKEVIGIGFSYKF